MAWRLAKSLDMLRVQLNRTYPDRNKASDGTIGDQAHSARTSDHNPNEAGVVCAFDCTNDPNVLPGQLLADTLVENRDERIKYVIWNKRMCRSYPANGKPAWVWTPYTGANAHQHHVHISVKAEKALYDSVEPWVIPMPEPAEDGIDTTPLEAPTEPAPAIKTEPEPAVVTGTTVTNTKEVETPTETTTTTEKKESFIANLGIDVAAKDAVRDIAKSGVTRVGTSTATALGTAGLGATIKAFIDGHHDELLFAGFLILLAVGIILAVIISKHLTKSKVIDVNADKTKNDVKLL